MAAVAAVGLEAQAAEGQGDVVHHDEQSLSGDGFALQPVAHRVSAQVHVGVGFEYDQLCVLHPHTGHGTIACLREARLGRLHQRVDYAEADVVARAPVFLADVAQSDD